MAVTLSRWVIVLAPILASTAAHASPAFYTVTSTASGGTCTLQSTSDPDCTLDAAITAASGAFILFSQSVQGQTIAVATPFSNLTKNVTIDASPNGVTIDGGGVSGIFYVDSGANVVLRHLTIQHGFEANSGGALYNSNGNVTIDSCTFANNSANTFGGGAILNGSTLLVLNSTFTGNHSGNTSGAIYAGGSVVIANSTFAGNTADANGGAIYAPGSLTVFSSIFAANTAPSGPNILGYPAGPVSLGYNLIDNATGSSWVAQTGDQIGVDPLFSTAMLANNGGPTQTIALQPGSPVRSGGDCSGNASSPAIPSVSVDQRGFARSTPCTIGAFDMTSIFDGTFELP
jgi:predicted outer membrane repeat protein